MRADLLFKVDQNRHCISWFYRSLQCQSTIAPRTPTNVASVQYLHECAIFAHSSGDSACGTPLQILAVRDFQSSHKQILDEDGFWKCYKTITGNFRTQAPGRWVAHHFFWVIKCRHGKQEAKDSTFGTPPARPHRIFYVY
ncbi:unnamed protein product [Ectocarpus sp. 12 AP-2014]